MRKYKGVKGGGDNSTTSFCDRDSNEVVTRQDHVVKGYTINSAI